MSLKTSLKPTLGLEVLSNVAVNNQQSFHTQFLVKPSLKKLLLPRTTNKSALWWEEHLWTGPLVMVTQDDQAWEGFKASVVLSSNPNFSLYVMTNYLTRMMGPIMNYQ